MTFIKKYKSYIKSILAILLYITVIVIGPRFLTEIFRNIIGNDFIVAKPSETSLLFNLYIYLILFIPLVIIFYKEIKIDLSDNKDTDSIAKAIIIGTIINFVATAAISMIQLLYGHSNTKNEESIQGIIRLGGFYNLISFIVIGIIGPVVEELVFRKSLGSIIKNKYLFIAISSLLFGYIHLMEYSYSLMDFIIEILPYLSSGIIFSYFYEKNKRNLMVPLSIHIANNALPMLLTLLF